MRYVSLFSGIGAGELALSTVFKEEAECIGFSEIDEKALTVYRRHFPDHTNLGDVRHIDGKALKGKVDLIIGGSPCQGFSSVGLRRGMDDPRSALFFHFVRLIEECQPKYFILENVRSMRKAEKEAIDKHLGVQSVIIDAAWFTAQARPRRFWCNFPVSIPDQSSRAGVHLRDVLLQKDDSSFVPVLARWWRLAELPALTEGNVHALTQRGHKGSPIPRLDGKSNTITCKRSQQDYVYDGEMVRLLDPIELERLQGFPDGYTDNVSVTFRVRLLGNAFCVPVVAHIARCLKDHLTKAPQSHAT